MGYETAASTKRTFLWGLVFIVPATLIVDGVTLPVQAAFEWQNLLNLLFLGVVASAACFVTWGVSVKHLGPTISTTYFSVPCSQVFLSAAERARRAQALRPNDVAGERQFDS